MMQCIGTSRPPAEGAQKIFSDSSLHFVPLRSRGMGCRMLHLQQLAVELGGQVVHVDQGTQALLQHGRVRSRRSGHQLLDPGLVNLS